MNRYMLSFLFAIVAPICNSAELEESPQIWGSYFKALKENCESIESFDVIFRFEPTYETNEYEQLSSDMYYRIIVDRNHQRSLLLCNGVVRNDTTGVQNTKLECALFRDGSCWYRSIDRTQVQLRRTFAEMAKGMSLPNFRMFGAGPFTLKWHNDPSNENDIWESLIGEANSFATGQLTSEFATFSYVQPGLPGKSRNRFRYKVDLESLAPVQLLWEYVSADGTKTKPRSLEHYSWQLNESGVWTPTSFTISYAYPRVLADGSVELVQTADTGTLRWLSVNKQIEANYWDIARWDNIDEIYEQCGKNLLEGNHDPQPNH